LGNTGEKNMRVREWGVYQSILEGEGKILKEVVRVVKPKAIFESGTGNGYATGWMIQGIKEAGLAGQSVIHSCDVRAIRNTNNLEIGIAELFFHLVPSAKFLRRTKIPFDFAFLDGDHSARTVYEELLRLRYKGCYFFLLHDVRAGKINGPAGAVKKFANKFGELSNWYCLPKSLATNIGVDLLGQIREPVEVKPFT
jgi:predicted O-methyltransferase YrrM